MTGGELTFRPMRADDLPRVAAWLSSPAAAPWFGPNPAALTERYRARLTPDSPIRLIVVCLDGRDIGFAQAYRIGDLKESLVPAEPSAVGIDYVIGEADQLGRGVGTRLIEALVELIAGWLYPDATAVVACPDHRNRPSTRVLEKTGFTAGLWFDVPAAIENEPPITQVLYTRRLRQVPEAVPPGS